MLRSFRKLVAGLARRRSAAPLSVRPANRRNAPRALRWGLVIFVLLQLSVGLAAELYPRLRDPLYGDKFAKLKPRLKPPEQQKMVVMLGSSRTGLGFHGKRVEAQFTEPVVAFNYGVPASGPITHLVYLKRLLRDGVTPDLVLVELLPAMLVDRADSPLEQYWFFADRLNYSEQDTLIRHGFDPRAVRERWWKSTLIPWYTLRFQLMTRISPSWLPWQVRFDWSRSADECGWGTMQVQDITPEEQAFATRQAKAEYAPVLGDWKPGGPAVAALHEILDVCKERNIPVRLVLMPEGSEFRALYPPLIRTRLNEFLATLPGVVDAREWLPDAAFRDGHHMFAAGAEAFTDRLTREVIAPGIR